MKGGGKIKKVFLGVVTCLLFTALVSRVGLAASEISFSLDPSSATVAQGENVTLTARINSSRKLVDSVDIGLTYDQSFIEFVSIDSSSSAFGVGVSESGGSGKVQITRGSFPPFVKGEAEIAKITFKVKSGSGPVNTNIEFADYSVAVSEGENLEVGSKSGTSINLGRNDNINPDKNTEQGSNNNPNEFISTEPFTPINVIPSNPKAPKLADLFPKKVGFKNVVISWRTNMSATSIVEYGLTQQLGFNVSERELKTNHELSFDRVLTKPGQKYYYRAKSTNPENQATSSGIRYVYTRGYTAIIAMVTNNKNSLDKTEIIIDKGSDNERKTQLNSDAQATFGDLAPGDHVVSLSIKGREITQNILIEDALGIETGQEVADDAYVTPQYFRIEVENSKSNLIQLLAIIVGLVVLVGGLGVLVWKLFGNKIRNMLLTRASNANNNSLQPTSTSSISNIATNQNASDDLDTLLQRLPGDRVNKPGNVITPNKSDGQSDDGWE